MKLPTSKAELITLLDKTEKALADLIERKAVRIIPGVSATLPSPTKPIQKEVQNTVVEEK